MLRVIASAISLSLLTAAACDRGGESEPPTIEVSSEQLGPGGLYVVYVWDCQQGCDRLAKGDLIVTVDGQPVQASGDLDPARFVAGVRLGVRKPGGETVDIDVVADKPPFHWIGAAELDRAPRWARRNLFGHVSPRMVAFHVDGNMVNGGGLLGKKRLLVFWDHATRVEQAQAVNIMQVLQMAAADLQAAGVDVLFVHHRFPTNDSRQAPMNDNDLRRFYEQYTVPGAPPVPMYRYPNPTETGRARISGYEGMTTYYQYLRESPAIVVLDERGVIRWHSEGLQTAPADNEVFAGKDDQYTIIQAIEFAQKSL
jgi:hypothetical protein